MVLDEIDLVYGIGEIRLKSVDTLSMTMPARLDTGIAVSVYIFSGFIIKRERKRSISIMENSFMSIPFH